MKPHRYLYLYQPMARFFRSLSAEQQMLVLLAKTGLILILVGFELAHFTNLL